MPPPSDLKYGEPLARETFQVRPGLEAVVEYGAGHQVCRIEFPVSAAREEVDEVLDELVPLAERGQETGRSLWIFGGYSRSCIFYEHIVICEHDPGTTGVTIIFRRPGCNSPNPSQYHEA
jgi:hypothetical protein